MYLDSVDFAQYRERITRDEGARLFRLRWYGMSTDEADQIFVERKTHHEDWSGEKSTAGTLLMTSARFTFDGGRFPQVDQGTDGTRPFSRSGAARRQARHRGAVFASDTRSGKRL